MAGTGVFQKRLLKALENIIGFYEKANNMMSLMTLKYVRSESVKEFVKNESIRNKPVLDAGCGPGVMSMYLLSSLNRVKYLVGMDPIEKMLLEYRKNLSAVSECIDCVRGVFEHPPFRDYSFGGVIVAFAIRDSVNILRALYKLYNILCKGGCIFILELGKPYSKTIFRELLRIHFKITPVVVGAILDGARGVANYRVLGETYDKYPFTVKLYMFTRMIAGRCRCYYMLGGAVSVIIACRF